MSSSLNRRFVSRTLLCVVLGLFVAEWRLPLHAQKPVARAHWKVGNLEILQARPNVYVIFGAGGNIIVHDGWMGLVVDSGPKEMADQVLAAIKDLRLRYPDNQEKKIRLIINTGADPEHVGGNEALAKAGENLLRLNVNGNFGGGGGGVAINSPAAEILAQENVLSRMSAPSGEKQDYPVSAWPTQLITNGRTRSLYLNNDPVQFLPQRNAHSDADTFVRFSRADVVAAGDILDLRHFPIIDIANGGTINGEIDALTRLVTDYSVGPVPFTWHDDRTLIVPGHGRLCSQGDVVEYRDMLTIIRDRVQDLIKKGRSLDEIKKSNPTGGYRKQYGSDTGPWTTDMFVEAVHKSLTSPPKTTN